MGISLTNTLCYKVFVSNPSPRVIVPTNLIFVHNPSLTELSSVEKENGDDRV